MITFDLSQGFGKLKRCEVAENSQFSVEVVWIHHTNLTWPLRLKMRQRGQCFRS